VSHKLSPFFGTRKYPHGPEDAKHEEDPSLLAFLHNRGPRSSGYRLRFREFVEGARSEVPSRKRQNTILTDYEGLRPFHHRIRRCRYRAKPPIITRLSLRNPFGHRGSAGPCPFMILKKYRMVWFCSGRVSLSITGANLFANVVRHHAVRVCQSRPSVCRDCL